MISFLDAPTLQRFVVQMATPIFRISEDPNAQDPQMGQSRYRSGVCMLWDCALTRLFLPAAELQTLAREVQDLLQSKIGTTAYSQVHNQIWQKAAMRRQERKQTLAQQVRSRVIRQCRYETDDCDFAGHLRPR